MTPAERAAVLPTGEDIATAAPAAWLGVGKAMSNPSRAGGGKPGQGSLRFWPRGMGQCGWASASCILELGATAEVRGGVSLVEIEEPPVWGQQQGTGLRTPPRPK